MAEGIQVDSERPWGLRSGPRAIGWVTGFSLGRRSTRQVTGHARQVARGAQLWSYQGH